MSFGDYLSGAIELLAVLAALGYGAFRLRSRLLGGWSGAPARLAEVVLGISLLVVVLELVGVVGLYKPGWVLLAAIADGYRSRLPGAASPARACRLPSPPVGAIGLAVALGRCPARSPPTGRCRRRPASTSACTCPTPPGTTRRCAARFVQEAQVGAIHQTEVLNLTVWFYPQNSELLHLGRILLATARLH